MCATPPEEKREEENKRTTPTQTLNKKKEGKSENHRRRRRRILLPPPPPPCVSNLFSLLSPFMCVCVCVFSLFFFHTSRCLFVLWLERPTAKRDVKGNRVEEIETRMRAAVVRERAVLFFVLCVSVNHFFTRKNSPFEKIVPRTHTHKNTHTHENTRVFFWKASRNAVRLRSVCGNHKENANTNKNHRMAMKTHPQPPHTHTHCVCGILCVRCPFFLFTQKDKGSKETLVDQRSALEKRRISRNFSHTTQEVKRTDNIVSFLIFLYHKHKKTQKTKQQHTIINTNACIHTHSLWCVCAARQLRSG